MRAAGTSSAITDPRGGQRPCKGVIRAFFGAPVDCELGQSRDTSGVPADGALAGFLAKGPKRRVF